MNIINRWFNKIILYNCDFCDAVRLKAACKRRPYPSFLFLPVRFMIRFSGSLCSVCLFPFVWCLWSESAGSPRWTRNRSVAERLQCKRHWFRGSGLKWGPGWIRNPRIVMLRRSVAFRFQALCVFGRCNDSVILICFHAVPTTRARPTSFSIRLHVKFDFWFVAGTWDVFLFQFPFGHKASQTKPAIKDKVNHLEQIWFHR